MEPWCQPSIVENRFARKRLDSSTFPMFVENPKATTPAKSGASVARRNARERRRIKHVNSAFDDLRKRVPCESDYRKISKAS